LVHGYKPECALASQDVTASLMKIPVNVKRDHIEALVASTNPVTSLAELIWNALDADAHKVTIRFRKNALGALESLN